MVDARSRLTRNFDPSIRRGSSGAVDPGAIRINPVVSGVVASYRLEKINVEKTFVIPQDASNQIDVVVFDERPIGDPVDLRNQDHANLFNVVLEAMNKRGRTRFVPEDISRVYTMIAEIDQIAGNPRPDIHPAFSMRQKTPANAKDAESASHAKHERK